MSRIPDDLRGQDIIDSRDVIERIEYLQSLREDALITEDTVIDRSETTTWTAEDGTEYIETSDWDESTAEELKALEALADEASGYAPDWAYGETLIADSYFTEYAEQLAEDIGAIDPKASWPLRHIDWEAAAEELKQDYSSVDFDGTEYWIRS